MPTLAALSYSFLFGLLHGILPDEHTWPITFSYAIGGASGREGLKAGLYFSAAFTFQRALLSELAYLALAPFLLSPTINGIIYVIVGVAMSIAGAIVLRQGRYLHIHFLGHHHEEPAEMEKSRQLVRRDHVQPDEPPASPPIPWTLVHGFIAGFGFGGFSLFVNTVAAPSMPSPWLGFLPGLLFGLGTMVTLAAVSLAFGASLRWSRGLSEQEIRVIGSKTGGRTLFFGGLLFVVFGAVTLLHLDRYLPVDTGYVLIGAFMLIVVIPAFIFSWREVMARQNRDLDRR